MVFAIAKAMGPGVENHDVHACFAVALRVEKRIDQRFRPAGHDDDRAISAKVVVFPVKVQSVLG